MNVLILTASPIRDEIVDSLIKTELEKYGHKVMVRPCLREGRAAITDELNNILHGKNGFVPDTVVMPPIRNTYSADMCGVMKQWGLAVVSRHTEPSCDREDFEKIKKLDEADKTSRILEILGRYPYQVNAELVWSKDEADILNQRKICKFKTFPVGAFTVDAYKRPEVIKKHKDIKAFRKKYNFDTKPIIMVCSPWGFADTAPDLHIGEVDSARKDNIGLNEHLKMVEKLCSLKNKFNILMTIHPNVTKEPYIEFCQKHKLAIDTETTSFKLNIHVDAIIHAGSTMAINAHLLNIPAYQYGDINVKDGSWNWWADPKSPISKVSPYFNKPADLIKALKKYEKKTNANKEVLKALENGRFGIMDGQSTVRAAAIIDKIRGKFTFNWPRSINDYTQLVLQKDPRRIYTPQKCAICGEDFYIINESWLDQATRTILTKLKDYLPKELPEEVVRDLWAPSHGDACPHCSARFFRREF